MDAVAPLLHSFYNDRLSPDQRAAIQAQLLAALRADGCIDAAAGYVRRATDPRFAPDPIVLHYALHAIETLARSAFSATPAAARAQLFSLLCDFLVAAYARNAQIAQQQTTPSSQHAVPSYVLGKAARAAVQLGKREWVADSTSAFPRVVLALIDQNGHSAASLPRIFAGMLLITVVVDDALDSSRPDMRSEERVTLQRNVRQIADGIVAALEIGMRISGPGLPRSVPVGAARAIGSLVRVERAVAAEALGVLQRCVNVNRMCDEVGAETLGVLAELFGESKVPLPRDWEGTLAHAASLLEAVAMGETARGDAEEVCLYRVRLVAYSEAIAHRVIGMQSDPARIDFAPLERLLNGIMGVTVRWASESPDQFPAALDAWINMFDTLDVEDGFVVTPLVRRVFGAVSQLCVEKCMLTTNGMVLQKLESEDEDEDGSGATDVVNSKPKSSAGIVLDWDDAAELMAEVGSNPGSLGSMLFMSQDMEIEAAGGEDDGFSSCTRSSYIDKCVEALYAVVAVDPGVVGGAALEFACKVLRTNPPPQPRPALLDVMTATRIAFSITPLCLGAGIQQTSVLLEVVTEQLRGGAHKNTKLGVMLFRTAASLARELARSPSERTQAIGMSLLDVATNALNSPETDDQIATAAALLLLVLDSQCRVLFFANRPPLEARLLAETRYRSVAALGVAGMTRWALVPERDTATTLPAKWTAEQWQARQSTFRGMCEVVFRRFAQACSRGKAALDLDIVRELVRGAALLRTMFMSVYGAPSHAKDAMWGAVGVQMSQFCLSALSSLKYHVTMANSASQMDEDMQRAVFAAMGCLVGTVGCILRVSQRHVTTDVPSLARQTIELALDVSGGLGSVRMARALLKIIRDQLGEGASGENITLVRLGVALGAQILSSTRDADVAVAAVGVLTEALMRNWLLFWPGDVAHGQLVGNAQAKAAAAQAGAQGSEENRQLYFTALKGILAAASHEDLAVCRSGLLGFEQLNASRKLYKRANAFRDAGAADATFSAAMQVLGAGGNTGRVSLRDEAVEVVWGIADADWSAFYGAMLSRGIAELGGVQSGQAAELVAKFGTATDRPSFARSLDALVNDISHFRQLNAGPTL